jgi:hypothetical protein
MDKLTGIFNQNPYYRIPGFVFPDIDLTKRFIFDDIINLLDSNFIISLSGLRRTGKTTILKQCINHLLSKSISPESILYYEFDEINNDLEDVLELYFNNVLRKDLYSVKCYIFLDELQYVDYWQVILKRYYDINPKIQFVISGSSSLYNKNIKESLTGRILNFNIKTLSFHEYLFFKFGKKYQFTGFIINDDFLKTLSDYNDIVLYKNELNEYLSYGEFPQYFRNNNAALLTQYYKDSILKNIFTKDINLFNVNNIKSFYEFFRLLTRTTAQEINVSGISRDIQINSRTLKRYQDIMEKMFLSEFLYKYEKSFAKQAKSFKKVFVKSINLIKAELGFYFDTLEKSVYGHIIETFVYNELARSDTYEIYYYNNTKTKKEIDFILVKDNCILPVEVKTSDKIRQSTLNNLFSFIRDKNLKRGIVFYGGDKVYTEKMSDNVTIECIPYYFI